MPKKIKRAKLAKIHAEPFIVTGDEKAYIPSKIFNLSNTTKHLTRLYRSAIMELVIKPLTKGRKKMVKDKTKKSNKRNALISIAWLVEASFRAFVGWVLLSNFDHIVTTAAALYALGTAAVIVVTHFFKANN